MQGPQDEVRQQHDQDRSEADGREAVPLLRRLRLCDGTRKHLPLCLNSIGARGAAPAKPKDRADMKATAPREMWESVRMAMAPRFGELNPSAPTRVHYKRCTMGPLTSHMQLLLEP